MMQASLTCTKKQPLQSTSGDSGGTNSDVTTGMAPNPKASANRKDPTLPPPGQKAKVELSASQRRIQWWKSRIFVSVLALGSA